MEHRCPLKTELSLPRQQRLNLLGIDRGETVTVSTARTLRVGVYRRSDGYGLDEETAELLSILR
ncbi:MAG TPA: hypothetical protein VKA15_03590, partial [Isosphaeraceae bacterium]|nr:hypothetical protein [Isosphaeraceae bacterium]